MPEKGTLQMISEARQSLEAGRCPTFIGWWQGLGNTHHCAKPFQHSGAHDFVLRPETVDRILAGEDYPHTSPHAVALTAAEMRDITTLMKRAS